MLRSSLVRFGGRVIAIAIVLVAFGRVAHADAVDTLIGQLKNDDSTKVRFAAAVNLTKLGDQKAILPMVSCVSNDSDDQTRAACAVGLGKLVTSSTKANVKSLVINTLKRVANDDSSSSVKAQATASLTALGSSAPTGGATTGANNSGKNGAYVNIGPMSAKLGGPNDAKLRLIMVRSATNAMGKAGGKITTSWDGGAVPTAADLNRKQFSGYFIDATLNSATANGGTISCKVSMLLASFPDKNIVANLNGGASVQGGASAKEQALSQEDCVDAVVSDMITKRVIPAIH
jgi:hypothetical protein